MAAHDDAFLQAIRETPEEDAPRLIYADWLEERGDPRGEFIRVQCTLPRLSADHPQRPVLAHREWELLAEHGDEWATPLAGIVNGWEFRRGFVEGVALAPGAFLHRAEELFRH